MPYLMDTDTAGDDVTSMLFALRWADADLRAVTVVAGNVYLEEAVANALYTVQTAGRPDVPVHPGADGPLMRNLVTAHYVHGEDGMGNSHFPKADVDAQATHAVDAILEHAGRAEGELEIIAQGPLTNLALALRQDPSLPSKIRRLWVMGGANNSLGNITPAAEFNFYVDPEAAHIVLTAGFRTVLVPWDVCMNDGILMRDELQTILDLGTPLSEFYLAVNRAVWDFMRREYDTDGIGHPDSLMMAMALNEDLILERRHLFVDVEYHGRLTAGYSVVDVMGVLDDEPNAEVVLKADKAGFLGMLERLLADQDERAPS